ncbi:MAG: (2Fe-2S) ferredoxin domain-containing protein [Peptococcaceae bacterium]|nr:(2Fe-2S) ferredoxin domain-containing protein [Peptococcaceae bacterium]
MSSEIKICMGSACHIKGAPDLVQAFQQELQKRGVENEVSLMGCFCKKRCLEGINVEVNNVTYGHVTPEEVPHLVDIALGVEQ